MLVNTSQRGKGLTSLIKKNYVKNYGEKKFFI